MNTTRLPQYYFQTLIVSLLFVVAWDLSGLDSVIAHWFFNPVLGQFEWTKHWLFTLALHQAIKFVLWVFIIYILGAALLPAQWRMKLPVFGKFPRSANAALIILLLITPIIVGILKSKSLPFCPWEVQGFGGTMPHYDWWQVFSNSFDKKGKCWPAGHASGGFGMLGLYFFAVAYRWKSATQILILALVLGFIMGIAQQIRGAHFMSHTLWTAWFAWMLCGVATVCLSPLLRKPHEQL